LLEFWDEEGRLELLEGRGVGGLWTRVFLSSLCMRIINVSELKLSAHLYIYIYIYIFFFFIYLQNFIYFVVWGFEGFCRDLLGASVLREGV
jgi:hypothetical protein